MATTTTNFGWDIPQSTDLVKDGATAIAALGQDIDTALVDLKGGTTGQVLAKNSNTDLDFTWQNSGDIEGVTAGTGISGGGTSGTVTITNSMATAIDAKGDLVIGTGADAFSRLAVGTDNFVLTAASGETTGVKWAAVSSPSFVGALATRSANQTISNSSNTTILWTTELFDTDGFHSTSVDTSRLTVPSGKGGYYMVTAAIYWAANSTGIREGWITKNGSSYVRSCLNASSTDNYSLTLASIINLAVGDYVEFNVKQTSGGNLDFDDFNTNLGLAYLGA